VQVRLFIYTQIRSNGRVIPILFVPGNRKKKLTTLSLLNVSIQGRGPFDLQISENECIAISGDSGTGKSLLLRAIVDIESHQGRCLLDDTACDSVPAPLWRQRVGLLPAKPVWWFDTVGEHFHHRDDNALVSLGFDAASWHWQISRLSSGEQQRLALLRLLQNKPQVLLLDEPTASLDQTNCRRVESLIKHYREQNHCPIIWVTHDIDQARRVADRHYRMSANGLDLEKGTIQ